MNRREVLALAALAAASPARTQPPERPQYRAIVFDAFPILDPRPAFEVVRSIFPSRSAELFDAWRIRQFEYQWLRALAGSYIDFERATLDALVFAGRSVGTLITPDQQAALLQSYLGLRAWPDAADGVSALRARGLKTAVLSNATPRLLDAGLRNSGIRDAFDAVLSTDDIGTFKPDPRAYRLAADVLGVAPAETLFVAFAGWDAAGAKWFGYPTFWLNRLAAPEEELGATFDGTGTTLADLLRYVARGP